MYYDKIYTCMLGTLLPSRVPAGPLTLTGAAFAIATIVAAIRA